MQSDPTQPNALALEYQAEYGNAGRNRNVADIVNNPNASGVVRVFGPGLFEKVTELAALKFGTFRDDAADPLLVGKIGPACPGPDRSECVVSQVYNRRWYGCRERPPRLDRDAAQRPDLDGGL